MEGETDCLNHRIRMFLLIWATLLFVVRSNNADPGIVCSFIAILLFDQNLWGFFFVCLFSVLKIKRICTEKKHGVSCAKIAGTDADIVVVFSSLNFS